MNYENLISSNPDLFVDFPAPLQLITDAKEISQWREKRLNELSNLGEPASWAEIGVILDDPYIVILRDLVRFPDGHLGGYLRLFNRPDLQGSRVVVMLPRMNGKLLLLRNFRHSTRSWHLEIPRGFGERGQSEIESLHRELVEETGGIVKEFVDLGIMHSDTGLRGDSMHLYFVELASIGRPETNEGIEEFLWVSVSELENLISSGEITDSFTITTYTRAKLRGVI